MLYIEPELKQAYRGLSDDHLARLPDVPVGGVLPTTIALVKRIRLPWSDLIFSPLTPDSWTLRVAIGGFQAPVAGTFPLTEPDSGDTTDPVSANPTDSEIETDLNALASITAMGGVTVAGADGFFVVTWTLPGERTLLEADAGDLVPVSIVDIQSAVDGDDDTRAVQTIRILQNVGALVTLAADDVDTTIAVDVLTQGDGTHSHKIRLTFPDNVWGGAWTFAALGGTSDLILANANAAMVQTALAEIAEIGSGNVGVTQDGESSYVVLFRGALANQAISGIDTDGSSLAVLETFSGILDCRAPGMTFLLSGGTSAVVRFEAEWQDGSQALPQKILGRDILITAPVITPESTLPGDGGGGGGIDTDAVKAIVEGYVGQSDDLAVSTAGTSALAPTTAFSQWFQLVTAAAGSGAYTRVLTLDTSKAVEGAIYRVEIDMAASANITLEIRNATGGGTLLQTLAGDSDNAQYAIFQARFDGTEWQKLSLDFQ